MRTVPRQQSADLLSEFFEVTSPPARGDSIADSNGDDDIDDILSSATSAATRATSETKEEDNQLVWRETLAVQRTKLFAILGIFLIGVAVSTVSFFLVKADEERDFATEFESYAKEVAQVSQTTLERSFNIVGSLSKSITNMALTENLTFPFFTHPNFDVVGGDAKKVSGVDVIILAPLVRGDQLDQWSDYTSQHSGWVAQGLEYRDLEHIDPGPVPTQIHPTTPHEHTHPGEIHLEDTYMPVWQMAYAPVNASIVNRDLFTGNSFEHRAWDVLTNKRPILSDACDYHFLAEYNVVQDPFSSYLLEPIFDSFDASSSSVVAFLVAVFPWSTYFDNIMLEGIAGVTVVVDDDCGDTLTYVLDGPRSIFIGSGDLHEPAYSHLQYSSAFAQGWEYEGPPHPPAEGMSYDERFTGTPRGHCKYTLAIYPSSTLQEGRKSGAANYAMTVAAIFAIILLVLIFYDILVARRQNRLMATAKRTSRIVSDLFPRDVQKRMMEEKEEQERAEAAEKAAGKKTFLSHTTFLALDSLSQHQPRNREKQSKPIADLFSDTTIFFADIVGFTAWSSAREPAQVFLLLETLYHAFDELAGHRRIFKVETIGDCYVAVSGLPQPRKDHAVAMSRFARDCVYKFTYTVKDLETSLGPETGDLGLRVGMHSGAVTGGVLRGDKARFQLFGDTMNTASRMESTSLKNRIQLSESTAALLRKAKKGHWIKPRDEKVMAKGKGELQTFWLRMKSARSLTLSDHSSSRGESVSNSEADFTDLIIGQADLTESFVDLEKQHRLVDWTTESLSKYLKEIEARRVASGSKFQFSDNLRALETEEYGRPLEQIADTVELPELVSVPSTASKKNPWQDSSSLDLGELVSFQLRAYVEAIARMHHNCNRFHNFEHSSHVTLATMRILSCLDSPSAAQKSANISRQEWHEQTFGISSDPVSKFACVLAALIHDIQHIGVPNAVLIAEKSSLASTYQNKSIMEQNSFELAWQLLMQGDDYDELRRAIYQTESEFHRFRQVLVNLVIATDMPDEELSARREARWIQAFGEESSETAPVRLHNEKATVLMEFMIQASSVSHMMQHWHVYLKWNEKLFFERVRAFELGRLSGSKHPAETWLETELSFFDESVIPLTEKLRESGAFGALSEEYLSYAQRNRNELKQKGQSVVEAMLDKLEQHGERSEGGVDTFPASKGIDETEDPSSTERSDDVLLGL